MLEKREHRGHFGHLVEMNMGILGGEFGHPSVKYPVSTVFPFFDQVQNSLHGIQAPNIPRTRAPQIQIG